MTVTVDYTSAPDEPRHGYRIDIRDGSAVRLSYRHRRRDRWDYVGEADFTDIDILLRAFTKTVDRVIRDITAHARKNNPTQQPKTEPKAPAESGQTWSVAVLGVRDNYVATAEYYDSKASAERAARDRGDCYVVKGTQMTNEPLGQVEEHDREAPYRYFR